MAQGWQGESKRHSIARKYGRTSSKSSISTLHSEPKINTVLVREKKRALLKDDEGNVLASVKILNDDGETLALKSWRAKKKGHGYGKELIAKLVQSRPRLWLITTDGLTEMGAANIVKALPDFKIIEWRRGLMSSGVAQIMSQSAIDYFIEKAKESREKYGVTRIPMFDFPESWHSKHKQSERTAETDH
jgi:hypothetical protein